MHRKASSRGSLQVWSGLCNAAITEEQNTMERLLMNHFRYSGLLCEGHEICDHNRINMIPLPHSRGLKR